MHDLEMPRQIIWLLLTWLFAVGGCIGSFINVVIYRLPAGLSLLHPPSRCPKCEMPIRATDNVPIFGWLWLRGRCRHCQTAISIRYPAVELLVALVFVCLAWVEPLSGGRNLPYLSRGISMADLWGVYAYHLFLLCSLVCAAFTEVDGHRLTWRLALPALAIGLLAPLLWPHLRPTAEALTSWGSLADGLLGAAAAGVLGALVSLLVRPMTCRPSATAQSGRKRRPRQAGRCDVAIALAWAGVFLGWPAAAALAAVTTGTFLLIYTVGRWMPAAQRLGPLCALTPWTLIWIVLWRWLLP